MFISPAKAKEKASKTINFAVDILRLTVLLMCITN